LGLDHSRKPPTKDKEKRKEKTDLSCGNTSGLYPASHVETPLSCIRPLMWKHLWVVQSQPPLFPRKLGLTLPQPKPNNHENTENTSIVPHAATTIIIIIIIIIRTGN